MIIKLASPFIPQTAIDNVIAVLHSGNLVQGYHVQIFEEALEQYLGVCHVILVSSGTAALHLGLVALKIGAGDEVIVPAFTFPATINVVELVGATPVLVDITLDDYCIDVSQIEAAITPHTKVIMPVHEFGQAANMAAIMELAQHYGLAIIEDAACALGTEFEHQKVGTFANVGCFSFHPRKAITTGEGGAIITNNDQLASSLRALRNHGIHIHQGKIDFQYAGFNYRMTDFQAALGLPQLLKIEEMIDTRIYLAEKYDHILSSEHRVKTPVRFQNRRMVYQTYHILLEANLDRDRTITALKQAGVEAGCGAYAINSLSYYQAKYGYTENDFPQAVIASRQGLALPIGDHVHDQEIERIAMALNQIIL